MTHPFWHSPKWRELYDERAGIMEYMGGMSREDAERAAEQDIHAQITREREAAQLQRELTF